MVIYSEDIIESLNNELSQDTAYAPSIVSALVITGSVAVANITSIRQEELLQDISELQEEVGGLKLEQDAQIRAIRNEVKDETKNQIFQPMRYVLGGPAALSKNF